MAKGIDIGWQGLEPRYKFLAVVLGAGIVGIAAYKIISGQTLREQNSARLAALKPGTPEAWAVRFSQAFYNDKPFKAYGGTDEAAIWRLLAELPSRAALDATANAYARLYPGENLLADLESELSTGEFTHFMTVVRKKP